MRKFIILVPLVFLIFISGKSQSVLTLEKCIETAFQNNLDLRKLANTLQISTLNYRQAKFNYLPTMNATANFSDRFGTTFDQNTFRRTNQATQLSNPSLTSNLVLFSGGYNYFTLEKTEADLEANQYSLERNKNDVTSSIVFYYFQVIYDRENLKVSGKKKELLEKQLDKTNKQYEAGVKTQADVMNLQSQLAAENLNHINNLNIFERDKLTLLQALDLNATDKYEFEAPPINESVLQGELPPIDNIYDYALKKFPDIREQEKRIESARYGWKASRAMLYPTLTFTASLYSSYSSNGVLKSFVTGPEKTPYFEQMKLNRGEFIALTLSIPVFNNYKAATNAQTAKINLQNTEIEYLKQRNNLIKKIQQAWLDASGARAKYDASEMQLQSLSENFTFAETRYEKGVIDFYTYIEILNNKTAAEVQKLNAGYDYILKLKILDLYQGKPLKF